MEFADVVRARRMIRTYDPDRAVPREQLEMLLKLAIRAPSAGHTQGWEFLVLDDITSRSAFWSATTDGEQDSWLARMQHGAGPGRLLLRRQAYLDRYAEPDKGWTDRDDARWPVPYWHIDTGMAAMILLLAAQDAGLAGCFFGVPGDAGRALRDRVRRPGPARAGRGGQPRLPGPGRPLAVAEAGPSARVRGRRVTARSADRAGGARPRPAGAISATIRSRSSIEANSTVILPLRRPSSTRTRVSKASDSLSGQLGDRRRGDAGTAADRRARGASPPRARQRDQLLGRAHRQPLGHDAAGQLVLLVRVVQAEQGARVPGRQHAGRDPALHRDRQVEQPDRVADLRPDCARCAGRARRASCRTPRAAAGRPPPLPAG